MHVTSNWQLERPNQAPCQRINVPPTQTRWQGTINFEHVDLIIRSIAAIPRLRYEVEFERERSRATGGPWQAAEGDNKVLVAGVMCRLADLEEEMRVAYTQRMMT